MYIVLRDTAMQALVREGVVDAHAAACMVPPAFLATPHKLQHYCATHPILHPAYCRYEQASAPAGAPMHACRRACRPARSA